MVAFEVLTHLYGKLPLLSLPELCLEPIVVGHVKEGLCSLPSSFTRFALRLKTTAV